MARVLRNIKGFINYPDKKLAVFDLDGTLTESKSVMDPEMAKLLNVLLQKSKVAIIGGGKYEQFKKQLVRKLKSPKKLLKNLFLFPTTSTAFYKYKNGWKRVYEDKLSKQQKSRILKAFSGTLKDLNYKKPAKIYGRVIEDRGSQITFSALGQYAPVQIKEKWNKNDTRPKIMRALKKYIPEFEIRSGGLTSIDVTRKGIDKSYGLKQIKNYLRIPYKNMLFVGDALYPGGNDYAARKTGVDCIQVSGPKETKKLIKKLLRNYT